MRFKYLRVWIDVKQVVEKVLGLGERSLGVRREEMREISVLTVGTL